MLFITMERRGLKVNLYSLKVGQTVGCMVSEEGELHVYIDGVDNGIVWTGLPAYKAFWGSAEVCDCTTKIQLVSGEWLLSIAVSNVPHPLHLRHLLSVLLLSQKMMIKARRLSITKPQEPPTKRRRHREDQVSNPQATPLHQTSSGTAKDTNTVLHQQNALLVHDNARHKQVVTRLQQVVARLQYDNARLQREVTRLQQDNARLKQDHQEEVTRHQ